MHTLKGEVQLYKDEQGLPYIDMDKSSKAMAMMLMQQGEQMFDAEESALETKVSLIQTVQGNYKGFTKREVTKAKEACQAQAMMGNPSKKDCKGMVSNNLIANRPVTSSDVSNTCAMFGPDLASIQGEMVQHAPAPVVVDYVAVPHELVDSNKVLTLAADVFFVDGTAYLLTVLRKINS